MLKELMKPWGHHYSDSIETLAGPGPGVCRSFCTFGPGAAQHLPAIPLVIEARHSHGTFRGTT